MAFNGHVAIETHVRHTGREHSLLNGLAKGASKSHSRECVRQKSWRYWVVKRIAK